ncbi:unnamed protein product, partial [Meganyctiphanes norvegica]
MRFGLAGYVQAEIRINYDFIRIIFAPYVFTFFRSSQYKSNRFMLTVLQPIYPGKKEVVISRGIHLYSCKNQCKNVEKDYANDPEVKKWLNEIGADFERESNDENNKPNTQTNQVEVAKGIKNEKENELQSKKRTERKVPAAVNPWSQFTSTKFNKLDSSTSKIIYDFNEEQLRREAGIEDEEIEPPEQMLLHRGVTGVYDVEELVELLREENAKDVVTIQMPQHLNYVDHMVIVSCKSKRHINSLAEVTRQIYNKKKYKKDKPTIVEGKESEWIAMDLGNIALHIMSPELREEYDLESLWTVGPEFDEKSQQSLQESLDPFSLDQSLTNIHMHESNANPNITVT